PGLVQDGPQCLALEQRVSDALILGLHGWVRLRTRLSAPVGVRMTLPDFLQVQADEFLSIGMGLVASEDLLPSILRQVGGEAGLSIFGEEDLLRGKLLLDLVCGEGAGVECPARAKREDQDHDYLENDDAPSDCLRHVGCLLSVRLYEVKC